MEIKSLKYSEQDNDWAKNVEDNPIHISQAKSGALGYYCMGCDKEMQAVKRKDPKYKSYFRHHTKDVDTSKVECVHASREYREKLAYFYFMRTKKITVPAIYKFPPKGVEGNPVLLQDKEIITATRIDREVTFFEDENGVIHSGKNTNIDERFLCIRPDAVFYNEEDNPILFLEFVVTHKPDSNKLNKLQRLGINTVQIIVPKLSEEEIEKEISKASKVKWTYNEIESNTEYVPIPTGNSERIPPIDEEQRKLFEESFTCRAAQIKNLLRSIERCLESQSYKRTEQLFEHEIQRIASAAIEHQSRLDDIQNGIESDIFNELESKREDLRERRRKLEDKYSNLEDRYIKKREEIAREQSDSDREIKLRQSTGRTEEYIRSEFELQEERINDELRGIIRQQEHTEHLLRQESAFEDNFDGERLQFSEQEERLEQEFTEFERQECEEHKRLRIKFQNDEGTNGEFSKFSTEERIRSEFKGRYEQIIERVNARDLQGGDQLSTNIKTILEIRRIFGSIESLQNIRTGYKERISIVKSGAWREWN